MNKGPYLNKIDRNFTTRDSLGIEGVATSMSADLCPIVNTVTPRAFYWPFMIWIYYDFYQYSGIKERTVSAFDQYLKRQDYFFVLSTLLNENSDRKNLVGITQSQIDLDESDGPYPFNPRYFKTRYGGMQYYNAGCETLQFITYEDDSGNTFSFPKLTTLGEEMALSFEKVIKDTDYYKYYRRNDKSVPKDVLQEYGKVINIGLKGFSECKNILRHRLFEINPQLTLCADYIKYLYDKYDITELDYSTCRKVFFDHIAPSGANVRIPKDIKDISDGWEIVVGRQYFTSGLEMIWKPMLEAIRNPKTINEWISSVMTGPDFTIDLDMKLQDLLDDCEYDFDTREEMIADARHGWSWQKSVEDGIRIILSVYNWIQKRNDFGEEALLIDYGVESQSISLSELIETIEEYREKPIKEFMYYVMQEWLINQHYYTAFEKMLQGRDGFYFEIIDGVYHYRGHDFYIDFQGIRMIQLMQVMKDLDML